MKIKHILSIALILTVGLILVNAKPAIQEDGISFYQGTFEEAKALAKKEKKIIFIDAFTTWCGPCKIMAKKVFVDKSVGDFYNPNFVNMKIDMESSEGLFIAKNYKVTGYPTYLYIDATGTLVHKEMGMVDANTFIGFGKAALKNKK